MNILKAINRDKEICEMKDYIEKETGSSPGLYFWDGETIDKYRIRLRQMVEDIKKNKAEQK